MQVTGAEELLYMFYSLLSNEETWSSTPYIYYSSITLIHIGHLNYLSTVGKMI